jgi:hypothetical protein
VRNHPSNVTWSLKCPGFLTAGPPCSVQVRMSWSLATTHLVGAGGRKRIEADIITGPAWTLEGRTFPAAGGAARTGTQFVA